MNANHLSNCVCGMCEDARRTHRTGGRPMTANEPKCERCGRPMSSVLSGRSEEGPQYRWQCVHANCELVAITARADAAELMMADIIKRVNGYAPGEPLAMCLIRDVPGLREWWDARNAKYSLSLKRNALIAERDRRRAALAEAERELEELTR